MQKNMQRGFSLISAIFLLVVLAGLGAAMLAFSTAQNKSQTMDVLGSRAYEAANAGVEWAAYNIETTSSASAAATLVFAHGTGTALAGVLSPFDVTVSYTAVAVSDAAVTGGPVGNVWTHDITASAVMGAAGTSNYVERVINAKM